MSQLQIFNHAEFGQVELIEIEGKPWFGATSIAKTLGYSNPRKAIIDHCRVEGVTKRDALTDGGMQQINFINEGNLYRLISRSKLPQAEKFELWVFDDVIPSIRKHGAYMTGDTLEQALTSPDFLIQLATKLKVEKEQKEALQEQIEKDKPKVVFAEALEISKHSILIGELAKLLKQNGVEVGQNRLFDWLRKEGYLMKHGEQRNLPTQKAMEMNLFEVKTSSINNPDGSVRVTRTTKVTGKGQIYFINKFQSA